MILTTTQNAVRDVTRPLTKLFKTRQSIFLRRRFLGTTYKYTMIAGVRSALGNKVAQVYVTEFGDVSIYHSSHGKYARTSVSCYFIYSGVP